uniref:Ig-like domain-containing protein n=1 Tax=Cyprinus carpio TaxID=7962 RepID=A0A8C1KL42_CYPCA
TFPNGTLRILRLTEKDGGNYLCMYQRPNGEDMELFQVEVLMRPAKIENTWAQHKRVANGDNFLVDCVASGLPDPEVLWSLPDGTMINNALQSDDSGTPKNYLGEASLAVDLEVASLDEKPSFPVPNTEVLSLEADGDDISLECRATGKPKPEFLWILPNGTAMSPGMKLQWFFHYLGNGTLHIMQTGVIDKGVYQCLAKNVARQAEKRYALEPGQKPHIRSTASTMKISVTYLSNGTLQVKETSEFDRGSYTCKATNTFGSSTLSYPVSVMVFPPQITHAPPSITRVNRGSPVILNCIAAVERGLVWYKCCHFDSCSNK